MRKVLIKNVKLLDGINYFGETSSIICQNGVIVSIEENIQINEDNFSQIIDGNGQFLTPTFIDVHSHSDISILSPIDLVSKKSSGFGVEIVGNCGLSCFPITSKNIDNLKKIYQKYPVDINWRDFEEYNKSVANNTTNTLIYSLTGHNTLHSAVASYDNRICSEDEVKSMQKLLTDSLEKGSLGLSFGLLYSPGRFADDFEIIELMKTLQQYEKIACVHLKSEGDYLLESVDEMLNFARQAGLKNLHISHLKTGGEKNFYKIDQLLKTIENAPKTHDVFVTFDRYPFCQSLTQLSVIGPEKFLKMPDSQIMETLQNSKNECDNFCDFLDKKEADYFKKVTLVSTKLADYQEFIGMKIYDIAQKTNLSCANLILDLIKNDSINTLAAFESMNKENMERIISHPLCMIGSDETARPLDLSLGSSHIRNFATTSEAINILTKLNIDKSSIIKKLSYSASQRFKIPKIGELKTNHLAKFNLINFNQIKTNATFTHPHQQSDGITPIDLT